MDVTLAEVDIVIMCLSMDWNLGIEPVILECELLNVLACLLRHKEEDHLGDLAYFEDALSLADAERGGHANLPLCSLLSDVANDDWLLSLVLDWHEAKVELVGEVEHGAAAAGPDRHDEFLSLRHHHQVVGVV